VQHAWTHSSKERNKDLSTPLLKEARALHKKSRAWLATAEPIQNEVKKKGTSAMTKEITAAMAGELYTKGKPVVEVAKELDITYGRARKLIAQSGTELRDGSTRLKGRTRPVK
jgi:hypothetical protein